MKPYSLASILTQQTLVYGRIVNLDLGSAEQPVAYRLITLGYRFGQLDVSGEFYRIRIVITIQELADMIRLSYETTGKVLADFEANGYIAYGRQKVVVYP